MPLQAQRGYKVTQLWVISGRTLPGPRTAVFAEAPVLINLTFC